MEEDDGLLERAMSRNVVIATPTLLIALLKAVEMGWREQRVAENAERIRKLGQELHERLAKALGDVTKVGSSLNSAVKNYNTLVGSLDSRLMPAARRFEQLGTQSAKEMPGSVEPVETSTRPLQAQETAGESAGEQDA
jgi:DNA recombination protein RmuC